MACSLRAEMEVRDLVDTTLSGSCSSAVGGPLFALSQEEKNFVNCQSGLPFDDTLFHADGDSPRPETYGEVTSLGARQLFRHIGLTAEASQKKHPEYQFYDLGSGGGRLVIQAHLEMPSVVKAVGIELSHSRHKAATSMWDKLKETGEARRIRMSAEESWGLRRSETDADPVLELHEGDLYALDISEATHIYVSSLCFSEEMLERLVEKIELEGGRLQVLASLRLLPLSKRDGRQRIRRLGRKPWTEFIEMSWTKGAGDGCPVYFYKAEAI